MLDEEQSEGERERDNSTSSSLFLSSSHFSFYEVNLDKVISPFPSLSMMGKSDHLSALIYSDKCLVIISPRQDSDHDDDDDDRW